MKKNEKKDEIFSCALCGAAFSFRKGGRKYCNPCSLSRKTVYVPIKHATVKCASCRQNFLQSVSMQRFCSAECRRIKERKESNMEWAQKVAPTSKPDGTKNLSYSLKKEPNYEFD